MEKIKSWLLKETRETKALLQSIPALTMVLFVLSVIGMNLLANKSIDLGVNWLALDAGMLLSWLSFLTMDVTVKRFGPKASIKLSFVAAFINLLLALIFFAASKIPGVWGESFVPEGGELINTALDNTFGGTWYVVMGSTVAFLASSVVNNLSNWGLGKLLKGSNFGVFAARSYLSTMIGQFVDNFLFAIIVSLNFFGWSILQCVTCSLTGMVFELLCEVVFSPIGYRISRKWEREKIGEDYIRMLNETQPQDEDETCNKNAPSSDIEDDRGEEESQNGAETSLQTDEKIACENKSASEGQAERENAVENEVACDLERNEDGNGDQTDANA